MDIKKLLLSVIAIVTALAAHCADFTVDLLSYDILDTEAHTVQLSSVDRNYPNKQLNIPETVVYDGVTYTVTSVNIRLSSSHKNISAITIPKTVTDIKQLRSSLITQISFDEGSQLKNIWASAFSGCRLLPEFKIPESVEYIGASAFSNCRSLKSIDIPESIDTIRASTFYYCDSLMNVKLPTGLKAIERSAFSDCRSLKSIDIPESIDTIKASTFRGCDSLMNVKLPSGLKVIGEYAFYKSGTNILKTSITLPEQLDSIGSSAFSNADIYPTSSVPPALAADAFGQNVTAFIEVIPLLDNYFNDIRWRPYIKGPVINVGDFTYQVITSYKAELIGITPRSSITVPETISYDKYQFVITAIRDQVFDESAMPDDTDAEQIKEIRIKARLTSIGKQHFPSSLTYIELPQELQRIEANTFSGCRMLTSINIPDSVEYIGVYAFGNCGIETFTAPKKLRSIAGGTFDGCSSLKTITLHDDITFIGSAAFRSCAIENIKLPTNIETMYLDAFGGSKITELRIPHTIKYINGNYMQTITGIAEYLKNIFIIGGTNERYCDIDGVLFGKDGEDNPVHLLLYPCNRDAAEYTVPDGTMYIESHAFARPDRYFQTTTPLKKVNLPEGLQRIGFVAFGNNYSLESVNFPKSLKSIESYAFSGDRQLIVRIPETDSRLSIYSSAFTVNTAYLDAVTPPSCSSNPISGGNTICVKPEAVEAYRNDDTWSKYRIISDAHEADGLIYVPEGDNKAELAGYIKTPENTFDIPQTVNIGGKTRTVTAIGPNALALGAFTSVNVPKTVESIGQRCFDYCDNLTSVHIAEAKVQQPNLNLCGNLQNISADESNTWHTVINGVLYNKAADTLQAYPVASTCESFVLPESVKAIENTVCNYDLSETGFKSFYSTGQTPPACGSSSFSGVQYNQGMTLYVPQNSVQEYSEAEGWRYFNNIVGLTDDEIRDVLLTSVSDIKADDNAACPSADVFYTISGQRVTKPGKGIYIRNGKKVVVR